VVVEDVVVEVVEDVVPEVVETVVVEVVDGDASAANVATSALQLVLAESPNVAAYDPVAVAVPASVAARDVPVSWRCSAYPAPAVTVPA
jgi:hypothetical protein